jgi:hypothetical protein
VRWLVLVVLSLGCSSKPADPVDASSDAPDVFIEDSLGDTFVDDTSVDDTQTTSCFTSGDPCVVNGDCCSLSCIGVTATDGGAVIQTCQ